LRFIACDGHATDLKFRLVDRREAFEAFHTAVEAHASKGSARRPG